MQVVIDTSVLVGLLVPNDLWHQRAATLWEAIKSAGHTSLYLDCVAAETISAAARRLHEKKMTADVADLIDRLQARVPADDITWVLPDAPRLYADVLELIRTSSGALNFNDALIALACHEREIPAIASFDADFDQVTWLRRISRAEDLTP